MRAPVLPSSRLLFLLCAALFFLAAAGGAEAPGSGGGPPSPSPPADSSSPRFLLHSPSARPGDPVFASLLLPSTVSGLRVEVRSAGGGLLASLKVFPLPAAEGGRRWGILGGLPWTTPAGPASLVAGGSLEGRAFSLSLPLEILPRDFPTEDIALDKGNSELRSRPDPKKTAEALEIQALYSKVEPAETWASLPFVSPVGAARRSAGFGDRRRYLYATGGSDSSWHTGLDFAVPVGTPVLAPAAGRVVFSGMRIVTGYTLVIEHGPGLYSVLMHLSKGVAPLGSLVKAGELVAYSGVTGLATGPHLHWEIRAGELPVDPDFFLGTPLSPLPWLDSVPHPGP